MSSSLEETRDFVRRATLRLVGIRSVSPGEGEMDVVREALQILRERGSGGHYAEIGIEPIPGDPWNRGNGYALLLGESRQTMVLFGHVDTVDTADYGPFEHLALDPEALKADPEYLASLPELAADLAANPDDWMFGRGAADMKAGVAALLEVMRRMAAEERPPLSLLLLLTPDEENESAGILGALGLLAALRERYELQYVGAINPEYTTELYPGDPHRYIFTGAVGKLLPSFFVVGAPAHAADPFAGLDANLLLAELVRDLDLNVDLCDEVPSLRTAPPISLHAADGKTRYDTQLPYTGSLYLNVVTLTTGPDALLDRLGTIAANAMERVLRRVGERERQWRGDESAGTPRTGAVLTYAALKTEAEGRLGETRVRAEIEREWNIRCEGEDTRARCLRLVQRVWEMTERSGPAIVLSYLPPYYPHTLAPEGPLLQAVDEVVRAHPDLHLVSRPYFPLFSDTSYLRLESGLNSEAVVANMPGWREALPGAYSLPLEAMRSLDIPGITLGPYGRGVHQRGERVLMSYSFGVLPRLILEIIDRVADAK